MCFFWAELYLAYTAESEMYQTKARPSHVWWWAFWASQPQPEQVFVTLLKSVTARVLLRDICRWLPTTLRILGKNSLVGWFMFQYGRYSVLWKQVGSASESEFLCLPFLFSIWNFTFFYQINIFILVWDHIHVGFELLCSVPVCHSFQREEGNSWYGCRT